MFGYNFPKLIVFISLNFLLSLIYGQKNEFNFRHFSVTEGLSNMNVLSICKDYKGYLWIGTEDGLNKFDGYDFVKYNKVEKDTSTLSNNYCKIVYEDKNKNLWVGTRCGLNLYNRETDNFTRFYFDSLQKYNKREYFIYCITEDTNNKMWIGTASGLFTFDRVTKKFTQHLQQLKTKYNFEANRFQSITVDTDGSLWLCCPRIETGLLLHTLGDSILEIFKNNIADAGSVSINPYYSIVDKSGTLWIGCRGGGLDKFNRQEKKFIHYYSNPADENSLSSNLVTALMEHPDGSIYVLTENGLSIFNRAKNNFTSVYNNINDSRTLQSNVLTSIEIDKQGTIFIGSHFGGIDIFDKRMSQISHYKYIPLNNSLSYNNISSFAEDKQGNIWIATDGGGLNRFDPVKKTFQSYNSKNIGLPNDKTISLLIDKESNLWIGTWMEGIFKFRINGTQLTFQKRYLLPNSKTVYGNSVYSIYQTRKGEIWAGAFTRGLYKLNKVSDVFEPYTLPGTYTPLVDFIYEDHSENLWIGTEDKGLFRIESTTEKNKNFTYNEYCKDCLYGISVFCIYEDSKKRLWIGTDFGLNLFNPQNEKFTYFSVNNGLPGESIYGILEDSESDLWISTNKGLAEVKILQSDTATTLNCRSFYIHEGLQGLQFNRWAFLKSRDGYMYFGGTNGFNRFFADSVYVNKNISQVYITNLYLFNKKIYPGPEGPLKKTITETDTLELSYKQNVFTLEFASINYINPLKNVYKYRLKGFDKTWNFIGKKRDVTYTNLPAGSYTFEVEASTNSEIWDGKATNLVIIIHPPFWNTLWFRIIVFLFLIVTMFGFFLYKTKQIRRRSELMEHLVDKRTKEVKQQKEEIEQMNIMLVEQKNELEAQTEELQAQAEELYNYTEALENSNSEVQKQRDDLSAAYEELNKYRNQLEELVMERTRDLIAAKDRAEESDSLKSAFLANMSHEIRTPLNAIIGFAKLLNSSNFNEKEKIDFTNIVEQNTNYLLNLVDDILDISKIESGVIKMNFMPSSINEALRDIDMIYAEEVKKLELKNISIQFITKISPEIVNLKIETDPVRLRQVITNLINNALKYTKKGSVEFGCQLAENNMLLYYVKDTGVGIKKENLEFIFERFRKFDDNSDEIVRGTGLGLAIVKQLVQLMKGSIWVESEYGKGSTFYFTLPVSYSLGV